MNDPKPRVELSNGQLVHDPENSKTSIGDVLIHCYDGKQLIITVVDRSAIYDAFRIPGDLKLTLQQLGLLVDRYLAEVFDPIIKAKYQRRELGTYKGKAGLTFPRIDVTCEDILKTGVKLDTNVLSLVAHFERPQ